MLKRFQKQLRFNQTDAEQQLWYRLRSRKFRGYKFRRQHMDQKLYDNERTIILEKEGFVVLRFWNHEVLGNIEGVLEIILNGLDVVYPPSPTPSE